MSLKKIKHLKMRRGNVDLRWHKNCGIEPDTVFRSSREVEHHHSEPAGPAAGRFGRQFKMQRAMIKRRRSETNNTDDGFGLAQLTQKRATNARTAGGNGTWASTSGGNVVKGTVRHACQHAGWPSFAFDPSS